MIIESLQPFCGPLQTFESEAVRDVGSMDGSDGLRFRRYLPDALTLVPEPNPRNVDLMRVDRALGLSWMTILTHAAELFGAAREAGAAFWGWEFS